MKQLITLNVNGQVREVWTSIHRTLLEVLREDLFLTGTKHGCELGECGTCSVLIDGQPTLSCLVLPIEVQEGDILTVEGLAKNGHPDPLQRAFAELGAAQCGYCTPGMLVTANALLRIEPRPTEAHIREALAGNLCRCTGYSKIIEAVELAAERMLSEDPRIELSGRSRSRDSSG
jgi:carbon-monoxide dehydrogenase small subunit